MSDERALYVLVRDRTGHVAHAAIGSALIEADWDASLTTLALRNGIEPLAAFTCDSPTGAKHAKDVLAELGDVEFDARDFEPVWFTPAQCVETINGLLAPRRKGRRRLPEAVRRELEELHRILADVASRSHEFYLGEVSPSEDLAFAGPALERGTG